MERKPTGQTGLLAAVGVALLGALLGLATCGDSGPPQADERAPVEAAAPDVAPVGDPDVFGVIEIGGSGVKPAVVRFAKNAEGEIELQDVVTIEDREVNAFDPEQVSIVAQAVKVVAVTMRDEYHVPAENIYVLGSSGISGTDHRELVRDAVNAAIDGISKPLAFVTADEEGIYGFEGVVSCITLPHRRKQVLFVDIGSSNTKATYAKSEGAVCGNELMDSFPMSYGTKDLARQVSSKPGRYEVRLEEMRRTELDRDLTVAREGHPGVGKRSRVYLGGGIAWSVATLTHPDDRDPFVTITTDDIERLRSQLRDDPSCVVDVARSETADEDCRYLDIALDRITDPKRRKAATDDYRKVVERVFTTQQLQAGVEILDAMADRWDFQKKVVFFARPARRAWMMGYILKDRGSNIAFQPLSE